MKSPCKWCTHLSEMTDSASWLRRQENKWGQECITPVKPLHNSTAPKKMSSSAEASCQASICFIALSLRMLPRRLVSIKVAFQRSISVRRLLGGWGVKPMPSNYNTLIGTKQQLEPKNYWTNCNDELLRTVRRIISTEAKCHDLNNSTTIPYYSSLMKKNGMLHTKGSQFTTWKTVTL